MVVQRNLFVQNLTSTTPQKFETNSNVKAIRIILEEYAIAGVPVTSSIPDNTHFFLQLDNMSDNTNFVKNGTTPSGIPLFLTGSYTVEKPKDYVVYDGSPVPLKNLQFKLVDPNNDAAVFSRYAMLFKIVEC
jgi:hypothetical protein